MKRLFLLVLALLTVSLCASFAFAATINVPVDHSTIQAAINAASNGDTINVAAGTYNENVVINNKQNIVIQGAGDTTIVEPASGIGFTITDSDDITIRDLKIHTTGTSAHGVWIGGGPNGYGNSNNLVIQDNTINVDGGSTGIYAEQVNPAHSGWTISGNTISAPNGVNIELYDVDNVEVKENTLAVSGSLSLSYSSELSDVSGLTVEDNTFLGNGDPFVGTDYEGIMPLIWIESDFINWDGDTSVEDITIQGNVFDDWLNYGILIGEDPAWGLCGSNCNSILNVNINYNDLSGSTGPAISSWISEAVDAENNWWGSVSGPGGGDVEGNVDYVPWLACYENADCFDGVGCTVDTCNSGSCQNNPDDGLCSADTICGNYYCDATLGCKVNYAPITTECRASLGDCDVAEKCTGSSAACPADAKSSSECRAIAGDCDVAENCDGVNNNCPTDQFLPASTVCKASAGVCDLAETCTGSSATCPADAKSTALCRAAFDDCDAADYCNGVDDTCPTDAKQPDGTICVDGFSCSIEDQCMTGECGGVPDNSVCESNKICDPLLYPQPSGCGEFVELRSPESKAYGVRKILIDFSSDALADRIEYSDNGEVFRVLCRNCMSYSGYKNFMEGGHELVVRAVTETKEGSTPVSFFVDSVEPKIKKTEPQKGSHLNGTEFSVFFIEKNVKEVRLYYGLAGVFESVVVDDCEPGSTKECTYDLNLRALGYTANQLEYYFTIDDGVRTVESKHQMVFVDLGSPELAISSPIDEMLYSTGRVVLDASVNEKTDIEYSLDGARFVNLCNNCDSKTKTLSLKDGDYELVVKATDEAGNYDVKSVSFSIDSKAPKIKSTEPKKKSEQKGMVSFKVTYDEDNVNTVVLHYREKGIVDYTNVDLTGCLSGKGAVCSIDLDLSSLDDKEVEYYFTISDFLRSTDSKTSSFSVDAVAPTLQITKPEEESTLTNKGVLLEVTCDEKVNMEYSKDEEDFRLLCRNCDEYSSKKYFKADGAHIITVRATDPAGNQDVESVSFTITP